MVTLTAPAITNSLPNHLGTGHHVKPLLHPSGTSPTVYTFELENPPAAVSMGARIDKPRKSH
ncbi:hypothetical protein, partial [Vibrio vulnificus]|uniref:hypothetical protein n=1 Tax=Vibrio vulnificus TaxID=672 RepID=UPI001EEB8AC4